jgi:hypothetical protein
MRRQTHVHMPADTACGHARLLPMVWPAFLLVLLAAGISLARAFELQGSATLMAGGTNEIAQLSNTGEQFYNGGWLSLGGRIEASGKLSEQVSLMGAYANFMRYGVTDTAIVSQWLEEPSTRGFRIGDIGMRSYTTIDGVEGLQYRHNLDRLYVRWRTKSFDLNIGRQSISFGVVRSIRPLDFITQNRLSGLAAEQRNGVDAIRIHVPTKGGIGEVDIGIVAGKGLRTNESAAYLRTVIPVNRFELSAVAGSFLGNVIVGAGGYTPLGDFGLRAEGTWVNANGFAGRGTGDYFRGTAGIDYAFPFSRDSYAFAEYHYNGAGADSTASVPKLLASPGYQSQSLLLLRRNYLVTGLGYQLSPAAVLQTNAIWGMDDSSLLATMSLQRNFADNWYLTGQIIVGFGDRQTEFNAYGRTLQIGLSRYF